jgi:hypothetical protein
MDEITHRLYRHMVWSTQRVLEAVQTLPDEALQSCISNPSGSCLGLKGEPRIKPASVIRS